MTWCGTTKKKKTNFVRYGLPSLRFLLQKASFFIVVREESDPIAFLQFQFDEEEDSEGVVVYMYAKAEYSDLC